MPSKTLRQESDTGFPRAKRNPIIEAFYLKVNLISTSPISVKRRYAYLGLYSENGFRNNSILCPRLILNLRCYPTSVRLGAYATSRLYPTFVTCFAETADKTIQV